ncbi:MAG: TonB family protein [Firmicutes bacterium]|nr:TonB family protein [Bacillota bacterium]
MQNPFGEESRLNRFILISVVLHAILFFALPDLGSLLEVDTPGLAGGGVIQVMHVETSVNPRPSPVTDRLSQTTVPRVTEPRPQPAEPPKEQAVAQVEHPQVPEPQVEQARPAQPEPEPQVEPEVVVPEVPDVPEQTGRGELLTSPEGPEVVVETEAREVVQPPVEARPTPEARPQSQATSGSGTASSGVSDEAGVAESGEGTAETAPPPPPPPASGRELHGGGGIPMYPKNAEHDGVEGVVFVAIEVSASGVLQNVVLEKSSGDERLDFQAVRYIEGVWTFASQPYDYAMQVAVVFSREDNRFVSNVEYGEVRWLNAP